MGLRPIVSPGSNGMPRTSACGPAAKAGNLWRRDRLHRRLGLGHWPTNPVRPLVYRHTLDATSCTFPDLSDLLAGVLRRPAGRVVAGDVMYFEAGQGSLAAG